jgi:hypothetical protein
MGRSFVPSIVRSGHDQTVYKADLETIIGDLMSGQYGDPVRVQHRRTLV